MAIMNVSFDEVRRVAFRALDGGGAAPGIDDDCGWGCAWLEACGGRPDMLLVVLSSIHWREAWKYGERAYRYCQHDAGHAIAATRYAAFSTLRRLT